MKLRPALISSVAAAVLAAASCSTTRVLLPGQSRLASNSIEVEGEPSGISVSDMSQYIKQQPNSYFILGWNPFLNVYNWSDSTGRGLSRFWRKIGVAPVVYDPSLVESSCANMTGHLRYLGWYDSEVDSRADVVDKIARVTYMVRPGHRYQIDTIIYELPPNPEFAAEFAADSAARMVRVGDYLSEKVLEEESARGAAYFRDLGYYDISKNNYSFVADTLTDRNILRYQIREHSRNEPPQNAGPVSKFRFGEVTVSHSDDIKFREDLLRKLNIIHPGDLYSAKIVNTEYNRFSALKVFNGVSIELTPSDSATVDCRVRLSEASQKGFKADLEASTNSSGLLGLSPQLSFYNKNIFHGGEWLTVGLSGNFQYMPNSDVRSTELGVSTALSFPRFVGLPYSVFTGSYIPRTEIKASYNYQNRPEYFRTIAGLSYGYTGQIGRGFHYQIYPLKANYVRLYNLDPEFERTLERNPYMRDSYKSHLDAGLSLDLYHTTDADIVPRTPYHYARLGIDLSGNLFNAFSGLLPQDEDGQSKIFGVPFTQYVRGQLDLGKTFRGGEGSRRALALHFSGGAGFSYGNSSAMPFEKQFFVGGASSMRGWQARELGPGFSVMDETFSIPSQTGDFKLEFDAEYRFGVFWKIEGALFAEAGNVWNFNDLPEDFLKSVAADWGLGLRVDLGFILLRLDGGFKLYDPSQPEESRFRTPSDWFTRDGFSIHFGVGYPF